ncbi:MAG TPA: response regulator [Bacteriovoracaceae bacterium]|nr:response regulator [Bacteriovoracaceae bacterium]
MTSLVKKVLIIDDDESLREVLQATLEFEGFSVRLAGHGQEALELLTSLPTEEFPDCMLLDLMMPIMDGNRFLEELKKQPQQGLGKIPVVVYSGYGEYVEQPQVFSRVQKPVAVADLIAALNLAVLSSSNK